MSPHGYVFRIVECARFGPEVNYGRQTRELKPLAVGRAMHFGSFPDISQRN